MPQAMMRTSSVQQQHTESSRVMRGAWKAEGEYISEPYTKQRGVRGKGFLYLFSVDFSSVGCDGRAHVIVPEYMAERDRIFRNGGNRRSGRFVPLRILPYIFRDKTGGSLFVNIRWYHETYASSF